MAAGIQVGAEIRFRSPVTAERLSRLVPAFLQLEGVDLAELMQGGDPRLLIGFDPYSISGKEILKWFALHTISADILPPASGRISTVMEHRPAGA